MKPNYITVLRSNPVLAIAVACLIVTGVVGAVVALIGLLIVHPDNAIAIGVGIVFVCGFVVHLVVDGAVHDAREGEAVMWPVLDR